MASSLTPYFGDHIEHDFYSLPFCQPEGGAKLQRGGERFTMFAEKRVFSTPYRFQLPVGALSNVKSFVIVH